MTVEKVYFQLKILLSATLGVRLSCESFANGVEQLISHVSLTPLSPSDMERCYAQQKWRFKRIIELYFSWSVINKEHKGMSQKKFSTHKYLWWSYRKIVVLNLCVNWKHSYGGSLASVDTARWASAYILCIK